MSIDDIKASESLASANNPIAIYKRADEISKEKYSHSCCCRTCPAAKRGDHQIPHNLPNSVSILGYFCVGCMGEMGIGKEHLNYNHGVV